MEVLQKKDHICPILLAPEAGPLVERAKALNITVVLSRYFFWIGARKKPWAGPLRLTANLFFTLAALIRIKKINPELIYTNTLAVPVGAIAAFFLKLPHIWHIRETVKGLNGSYDLGRHLTLCLVNRLSDYVIFNTQMVRKNYCTFAGWNTPCSVVYNGFKHVKIENQDKYGTCIGNKSHIRLVIAASLGEHKGQKDAILAVRQLNDQGYKVTLLIAGTGPENYTRELKAFAEKHSKNISFLGNVTDMNRLYQQSAATLICSHLEAFGRTAVESMLCGTPVIAPDSGGPPEIIEHMQTGLLYTPCSVDDLVEKIKTLVDHPELYNALVLNGRSSALKRFTVTAYANSIEKIINAI